MSRHSQLGRYFSQLVLSPFRFSTPRAQDAWCQVVFEGTDGYIIESSINPNASAARTKPPFRPMPGYVGPPPAYNMRPPGYYPPPPDAARRPGSLHSSLAVNFATRLGILENSQQDRAQWDGAVDRAPRR